MRLFRGALINLTGETMKVNNNYPLLAALLTIFTATASADVVDVIEKKFDFNNNGRISLSNINGDVNISACDCTQVHLSATISASDQESRDRISVDIKASQKRLSIETKYAKQERKHRSRNNYSEVVYVLKVPNEVELDDIELVNGDLTVSRISGKLNAELVNGQFRTDTGMSNTEVSTVNGNIEIEFRELNNVDKVKLESVNGNITVQMPSTAGFDVSAETVSGSISNQFGLTVHKGRYVGSDMRGTVGDGSINLSMENINGRIKLQSE